jgi:GNAT superfamily N-acetyltransferase
MPIQFRPASRFFPQDKGNSIRLLAGVDEATAEKAVDLYYEHPHLGEIILGYDVDNAVCMCTVNYGVSAEDASLVGYVDNIYVAPEATGKGLEEKIVTWTEGYLKDGGAKRKKL